jgi:hypothetical protein
VRHLHHHPFTNERAGIVLQLAFDEATDAGDLLFRDWSDLSIERNDAHHARALQDGEAFRQVEPREAVAGKQRPVDLLLAVFPAAPFRKRRQEGLDPFLLQLVPDDLLMP